jgi:polar amino acid transport system permease protein
MKKYFYKTDDNTPTTTASWLNIILVGIFIITITIFSLSRLNYQFKWELIWEYRIKYIKGYEMTFVITFFSLILSLFIGIISALALESKVYFFSYLARAYIEGIRGTPFLVQINFFYFIIATAFGLNNKYILGILILSIFSGAYVAEIIRGGIQSVPESQWLTAKSLCFTKFQTYRLIVFPQVIRRILPSLAGQLSSLVKDSSLLSVIAVSEFTMNVMEITALTYRPFENYTFLAIGYLFITIPISLLAKFLERKFYYES